MTNEDRVKKYLTVPVNFVYRVISLSIHLSSLNSTENSSFCHESGSPIYVPFHPKLVSMDQNGILSSLCYLLVQNSTKCYLNQPGTAKVVLIFRLHLF